MLLKDFIDLLSEHTPIALYDDVKAKYENLILFGYKCDITNDCLSKKIIKIFLDGEKEEIAIILD